MERKTIIIGLIVIIILAAGVTALLLNNKESADVPTGKLPGNRCSDEYLPVCGVNGITYGNTCMAEGMEIAHEGECVNAAGGTFPAGEVPDNATDEELASS